MRIYRAYITETENHKTGKDTFAMFFHGSYSYYNNLLDCYKELTERMPNSELYISLRQVVITAKREYKYESEYTIRTAA